MTRDQGQTPTSGEGAAGRASHSFSRTEQSLSLFPEITTEMPAPRLGGAGAAVCTTADFRSLKAAAALPLAGKFHGVQLVKAIHWRQCQARGEEQLKSCKEHACEVPHIHRRSMLMQRKAESDSLGAASHQQHPGVSHFYVYGHADQGSLARDGQARRRDRGPVSDRPCGGARMGRRPRLAGGARPARFLLCQREVTGPRSGPTGPLLCISTAMKISFRTAARHGRCHRDCSAMPFLLLLLSKHACTALSAAFACAGGFQLPWGRV